MEDEPNLDFVDDLEEITFSEADAFRQAYGMHDLTNDELADIWVAVLTAEQEED